ncbi:hypothetical protein EG329_006001 [Mollisiaceae sp. DMI_Dod_QoI]|nr:hypothetical protein EG329_006001 [Helotiales sp. DMI_Dod_QoI]
MATTNHPTKRIVKFSVPGFKPDVRLKVFDNLEFHVHSIMLKIHSGFFRKFLDSPEKKIPASAEFAYEWVTKIDDDMSWHLIAAQYRTIEAEQNVGALGEHQAHEERTFEKLLLAIYNKPYAIDKLNDLIHLTKLADYYCALRIVSRTLDAAMLSSSSFGLDVFKHPLKAMPLAVQLRNRILYKECLILLQGPWTDARFHDLQDPQLLKRATKLNDQIYTAIGKVSLGLTGFMSTVEYQILDDYMEKTARTSVMHRSQVINAPSYYRQLYEFRWHLGSNPFGAYIEPTILVKNDLKLNSGLVSGQGLASRYFLGGSIPDEDLPWDTTEEDW